MIDDISYFRRTIVRQVLMFLFWLSGLSVSISVIVWIRLFKSIFGNTYFVTNSVLLTFLFGLALGGYYFGKKIDKERNELKTYMKFELIIGVYLIFLLLIFPLLKPFYGLIYKHFGTQPVVPSLFIFLISFIFLITPSLLTGAAFPILSRFLIQSSNRVGREIGNLYGLVTLGAVFGCYLSGFIFFQIFGFRHTLVFAAILNLVIAGIVRFLLKQIEPTIELEAEFFDQKLKHLDPISIPESPLLKRVLVAGIFVSGFLSISYLVIWLKSFIFITENSTYNHHIMLPVFFVGMSIGAFFYTRFLEKGYLIYNFAIIEIIIGVLGIISIVLIPQFHALNLSLYILLHNPVSWTWKALIYFYDASMILILPAILIGMTIPMGCKIYLTNFEERGKKIGFIYSVQAFGAILGLTVTALVLLPSVGIQKSIIFLAFINFSIGLIILLLATFRYGNILRTSIVFGLVTVIFGVSIIIPPNMIFELFKNSQNGKKVLYIEEDINSTVTIHQDVSPNHYTLASNGITVTETTRDWVTIQRFHGHLPLLLHSKPDTVLTIGFRDGETIRSVLLHRVTHVDCIEKTPKIITASSLINGNRYDLVSNPKLNVLTTDRTNYIATAHNKYDIILNDVVHPAFMGNGDIFNFGFFRSCKEKLKPGGMMSCVIPLFKMSIEEIKIIINTFHTVFPSTSLWYNNNCLNRFAFLIGSKNPEFIINYNQIYNRLNDPGILVNLTEIGMDNTYEFLDSFIMGPKTINHLIEGVRLNRDNLPHLEFSTPKTADSPSNWNQALQLLANYRESVSPYLVNVDSTLEQREFVRLVMENYFQSTELVFSALGYELSGKVDRALEVYRQVYMMNRFDRGAKRYLDSYYDSLLIDSPKTPAELINNATIYYQKMEYEVAINLVNRAIELNPDYAPAYFALGINHEIMGDIKKAKEAYQKAFKLKPDIQTIKDRLDLLSEKADK